MKVINWQQLEDRASRMSKDELTFAIGDCREASRAMQDHNPELSNYYSDEASVYVRELQARKLKTPKQLTDRELARALVLDQGNMALIQEYCDRQIKALK